MALLIEIKAADGLVSRTRLERGANRFSVRLGDSYRIIDDQTGLSPQGLAVRRVDNNLIVDRLGVADTTVEFPEFYSVCSAGSPCDLTVDTGSGPQVAISPGTQPIGALADGSFVLYDSTYAETAPAAPSTADGTIVRNVLYGVGALAVVGLAAGGGGGGGGDGDSGPPAPNGTLRLTSSPLVNSHTPTLAGEGEPGSRVIVRIDTTGDGVPDVTYNSPVGSDGRWTVNLASAVPESGSLPAGGLPDTSSVSITSTTSAGNVSLPVFTLSFDGTPPGPAVINAIATDNVVNAAEKQNGFFISGTAEPGGKVILSIDGQALASTTANEAGQWQTTTVLSGATVPADGTHVLSAVVQDLAGNLSVTAQSNLRVDTTPPVLQASVAGGDAKVAIVDAASVGFGGKTDPGTAVQVQWNGNNKSATADGSGTWNVAFTGAEVPDSPGANFPYSIVATDLAGNVTNLPGQVLVDRRAPASPAIATVEGDNTVTAAERADGVPVSGQAEAGAQVQVSWGSAARAATADANGQWSVQFGPGDLPPVQSPGGTSTITAVATDAVGNTSPAVQFGVTIQQPFNAPTISAVEGDNIVNRLEASDGVVLSGTVQAGAAVNVAWGTFSGAAIVNGTTWTASVAANQVPADGLTTVTASIAGSGGGASSSRGVTVDKVAPVLPIVDPVETNNSISLLERLDGVPVTGHAEAGARISVAFGAATKNAVADASGAWTVSFTSAELPGQSTATLSVSAYDAADNASPPLTRAITIEGVLAPPALALPGPGMASTALDSHTGALDALLAQELQSGRLV